MVVEYANKKLLYGKLLLMSVFIICLFTLTEMLNGNNSPSTNVVLWLMILLLAGAFGKSLIDIFRDIRFKESE